MPPDFDQSAALGWLVLCRAAPLVWWNPALGAPWLPSSAKLPLTLALAAALYPSAWASAPASLPAELSWSLLALSLQEALVGAALAFAVAQTFWAVELAAHLLDHSASLAPSAQDPQGEQLAPLAAWLPPLTTALFVGAGGLPLLVAALARSWRAWPIGGPAPSPDLLERWALAGGEVLALGLALALPAVAARWMAEWALALAQRAAPRLAELFAGQASLRAVFVLLAVLASLWAVVQLALDRAWASALSWQSFLGVGP